MYKQEPSRYEERLQGLLGAFRDMNLSAETLARFFVVGGECNYLLRVQHPSCQLEFVEEYHSTAIQGFGEEEISTFLDVAEASLRSCMKSMQLNATILRKKRAVGLIPATKTMPMLIESRGGSPTFESANLLSSPQTKPRDHAASRRASTIAENSAQRPLPSVTYKLGREQLDECVLATQTALQLAYATETQPGNRRVLPPHCVFNGGSDVWCDIGNKQLGVRALQSLIGTAPEQTVHVGDQFLSTGNDIATRSTCCTLWIVSPEETEKTLDELLFVMSQV